MKIAIVWAKNVILVKESVLSLTKKTFFCQYCFDTLTKKQQTYLKTSRKLIFHTFLQTRHTVRPKN